MDWPDDPPAVTDKDRDMRNNRLGIAIGCRVDSFRDALVVALQFEKGLVQVLRLLPAQAVQIAALHWDEVRRGALRDIVAETPPTDSQH
jgi:hypothetical protein